MTLNLAPTSCRTFATRKLFNSFVLGEGAVPFTMHIVRAFPIEAEGIYRVLCKKSPVCECSFCCLNTKEL